jgi:hypothetical protein
MGNLEKFVGAPTRTPSTIQPLLDFCFLKMSPMALALVFKLKVFL